MGRRLLSAAAADRMLRHDAADVVPYGGSGADSDLSEEEVWAAAAFSSGGGGRTWWRQVDLADCRCHVGGLSRAFEGGEGEGISAPVAASLPDWRRTGACRFETRQAGEKEEEEKWVPPHEYAAREHGKSKLATSVFEGAGRTLKGRDMSRVRDAVWSQTGFFG